MFLEALLTIANTQQQPKCPPMDGWITWHIHTQEYYSAKKNNGILLFATTWMDLEGIMLNKICLREKHEYYMISLNM